MAGNSLQSGAVVDHRDFACWTPLHYAAAAGNTKMAALLLTKGAESWAMTNEGKTPYDLAEQYQRTETAVFLKKHNMPLSQHSMPILYRETTLARAVTEQGEVGIVNRSKREVSAPSVL